MNLDNALSEAAYSEFLDQHAYDEAEGYLFTIVRTAFMAGWRAAGSYLPGSKQLCSVSSDECDEPPAKS